MFRYLHPEHRRKISVGIYEREWGIVELVWACLSAQVTHLENGLSTTSLRLPNRHREAGDQVFVFLGPEEKQEETSTLFRKGFGDLAIVVPDLTLIELAAAFSTMDLVIG